MSVILGYRVDDKVYLASDNRLTNTENNSYSDENNSKLIILNNHVAVVCSGNKAAQGWFENVIKELDTRDWVVDEVAFRLMCLCGVFKKDIENPIVQNINKDGAYFLVGGKDRHGKISLRSISWNHMNFQDEEVTYGLFRPLDVDLKTCCDIYKKNIDNYFSDFMKKTIKEVSDKSKVVSSSGDIWIYDIATGKSSSEHFFEF